MKITVLIPTYRRSQDLARCLESLKQQFRPADEIIVVVQAIDDETWQFLTQFDAAPLSLQTETVSVPGQVAALNAGLAAAKGDIIAITDDDAVPHHDWLKRIEAHFVADDRVGGVGGRDQVYHNDILCTGAAEVVGRLQWFGRAIGNHHIGVGTARAVDILKGANMSYRRSAIAGIQFDSRLRGTGAQVHNDLAFSLAVKKAGWQLIYDPSVVVDHHPAVRFDEDQRHSINLTALSNQVHNETLVLLGFLPFFQRILFLIWAVLIGTRTSPGLIQILRCWRDRESQIIERWQAALTGRYQGYQTWLRSQTTFPAQNV